MSASFVIEVRDASQVGQARRAVASLISSIPFNETEAGQVSIIVSEMANNLVKHTVGGELIFRTLLENDVAGVEILAVNKGPGFNVARGLRDGYSSIGTAGTGLGAISRLSSVFDIYSTDTEGTVVFSQLWQKRKTKSPFVVGAVCLPMKGEEANGDDWAVAQGGRSAKIVMVDGLGHGVHAAEAARAAIEIFKVQFRLAPDEIIKGAHQALRATRGGAISVMEIDAERKLVRHVGLGNISGTVVDGEIRRSMVSHPGTVGADIHRLHEFQYPWSKNSVLVLHSDGLTSRWKLENYPGLQSRHPSVIAAVLYRDFQRGRDDVAVLVVREDNNQ